MSKTSKAIVKPLNIEYRIKCTKHLVEACKGSLKGLKELKIDESKYMDELETQVYNRCYLLGSLDAYKSTITSLLYNLRHNGLHLISKYKPAELVKVPVSELGHGIDSKDESSYEPVATFTIVDKGDEKNKHEVYELNEVVNNLRQKVIPKALDVEGVSMYKCPKCKIGFVDSSNNRQTSSADEGMTVTAECKNCGHQWKQRA